MLTRRFDIPRRAQKVDSVHEDCDPTDFWNELALRLNRWVNS